MIKTFKGDFSIAIFRRKNIKGLPTDILKTGYRKLIQLDEAKILEDMKNPPRNFLEPLEGDRKGQWSVRINLQWRVCFKFKDGDAYDVEIVDYHK